MLLSQLIESEVQTESGETLGRVHDVRVERLQRRNPDGHRLKVIGLVTGERGIRERLGLDTHRTERPIVDRELIEWDRVTAVDLDAHRIVVRD